MFYLTLEFGKAKHVVSYVRYVPQEARTIMNTGDQAGLIWKKRHHTNLNVFNAKENAVPCLFPIPNL